MRNDDIHLGLGKRLALEIERLKRKKAVEKHELQQLFWECTLRCGLSCRHCGSDCHAESERKDMPIADFLKVIDQIQDHVDRHRCLIVFSGGEPLMRTDLEECGAELYRREFPWGMVTNGMLLTEKRFRSLLAAGLRSITVSLDGFEAEHNWLRGHPDSFRNAIRAVGFFKRAPRLVWDVVTCVNKRNIGTLPHFAEYLISIGVTHWRLFTIFPSGRAKNDEELLLDAAEYKSLLNLIARLRKEGRIMASFACEGFLGPYEKEVRGYFYRCIAGVNVASVRIDGAISACTSIRAKYDQGNIYTDDFWEVWQNRFQVFRNRDWAKTGICSDCRFFRYCEGNGMHLRDDAGTLAKCSLCKGVND